MQTFKEAYYMGKHRSAAWHADGGANDEGWGRDNSQRHERRAPDHPHSVHINGKKWKTFGSHSHATNVARKIKGATVHREEVELDENWLVHKDGKILKSGIKQYKTAKAHAEKHGAQVNSAEWYHDKISSKNKSVKEDMEQIDELSDTTLMSYAQKVHDDSLKHDKDPSKRSAEKRNKSVMGFSRAVNKLEARPHKESADMCNVCGQTPCNCTHISEAALDPSEIAGNPKMYDAATVKKAYYHKNASESDKQSLARHLDRHHGNKEWRKSVKEELEEGLKPGHLSPGWMIKSSPELKAKLDAIKARTKAMRKAMGNPNAGKSVNKDEHGKNMGD